MVLVNVGWGEMCDNEAEKIWKALNLCEGKSNRPSIPCLKPSRTCCFSAFYSCKEQELRANCGHTRLRSSWGPLVETSEPVRTRNSIRSSCAALLMCLSRWYRNTAGSIEIHWTEALKTVETPKWTVCYVCSFLSPPSTPAPELTSW